MKKFIKQKPNLSRNRSIAFVALAILMSSAILLTQASTLAGDLNDDNKVDVFDVSMLLGKYNSNDPIADINKNGVVDIIDLSTLLSNFGKSVVSDNNYSVSYWNTPGAGQSPSFPTTSPTVTKLEATIDHNWGRGAPDPSVGADDFVARWTKTATSEAASYTFNASADDGIKVYIDNQLVIDAWVNQSIATPHSVTRQMSAGQHTIKVEYYEDGYDAGIKFGYAKGDIVSVPAPPTPPTPPSSGPTVTKTFTGTNDDFPNPERGFFRQQENFPGTVPNLRGENFTMVRGIFRLDNYRSSDIPASYLTSVSNTFADARNKGMKLNVKFAYNYSGGAADAPLSRVLRHIEQLAPVVNQNKDVIAVMDVGFVGAWGEWHSSTNGLNSDSAERQIVEKEMALWHPEMKLALRYPKDKRAIAGSAPVTAAQAHTNTLQGRIGHENDCFLANHNDGATWQSWISGMMEQEKNYVAAETNYVPQGGETCILGSIQPQYSDCSPAKTNLARFHYSFLNRNFYTGILDGLWVKNGCMPEIQRRMGYRLRMVDATVSTNAARGSTMTLQARVANEGYAAPYNKRPVDVVLRSSSGAITKVRTNADPRFWLAGQTATANLNITVPASLAPGSYQVLLSFPDPNASIANRTEYAIRLANTGVWESGSGFNSLGHSVNIQ